MTKTAVRLRPWRAVSQRKANAIRPSTAVNQMPLVFQANTLLMQWCVDCHRDPEQALRPKDQVFNMDWKAPENQAELGAKLRTEYKIRTTEELVSCSTCHR